MKIAVNTRMLIENKLDGIGWFAYETMRLISLQHPEHTFFFFFDRPFPQEFVFANNVHAIQISPPARHPLLWYYWTEYAVNQQLKKIKPDIFVSLDGFIPLHAKLPCLAVIHDINFFHNPKDLPFFTSLFYNHFFPKYAQKASRIATVSEFTKQDLVENYHLPAEKIDVIFNGVNHFLMPINQTVISKVRQIYTGGKPYFIAIGSIHPRKNILRLLQAFNAFKTKTQASVKLVIVGQPFFKNRKLLKYWKNMLHKPDVIFTGRIDNELLNKLLASSLAMVYVSYFEGFGIPALEAMQCQVPLIAAATTALPEVVEKAAMLVNPYSIDAIETAMNQVHSSADLRKKLVKEGNSQVKKFSWQKTANLLWQSIEKTVS